MTLPEVNVWGTAMVPLIGPAEGEVLPLVQSLNGSWDGDGGYHDENTFTGAAIYLHSGRAYMQGRITWIDPATEAASEVLSDVLPARFRPLADTDFSAYNDPGGTHESELGRYFTVRVTATGHIQIVGRLPHGEVSAAISLDNIGWDVVSGASDSPPTWLTLPANAHAGAGENNTYTTSGADQAVHNNRVHLRGTFTADGAGGSIYGGFIDGVTYGTPMPHPPTRWQDTNRMMVACSDSRRYCVTVEHSHGRVGLEPSGPDGTGPIYELADGGMYRGSWTADLLADSSLAGGDWLGHTGNAHGSVTQPASKLEYVVANYIRVARAAAVGTKGALILRRTGDDYYKVQFQVTTAAVGSTPPVVAMELFKVAAGVPTTLPASPLASSALPLVNDGGTAWRGFAQAQSFEGSGNLTIAFAGGSGGFVSWSEPLGTGFALGQTGYATAFGIDFFSTYIAAIAADVYPPSSSTLDLTGVGWIPDLGFMSVT